MTTTWGEWRRRHPQTLVLSRETGHRRDYSEGAAYRDYFATDALMFGVPELDTRLPNKQSVLGLRFGDETLALSVPWLIEHPVHHDTVGGVEVLVLTDPTGASRVYEGHVPMVRYDGDATVHAKGGGRWTQYPDRLESKSGETLARLPAHNAFWFGWRAAFPETRLIY